MKLPPINLPIRLANGEMATHLMLAAQALFHQRIERYENKVFNNDIQDRLLSQLRELMPILKGRTTAAFIVEHANDGYARMRCADEDIRKLVALACEDHAKLAKDYPCYEFFPVYRQMLKLLGIIQPGYFSLQSYVGLKLPIQNTVEIANFANRAVRIFCKVLQRSLVKKAQENFERSACDNFEGLLGNIAAIAERYPNAVVLRFETLYRPTGSEPAKYDDKPQIGHVKVLLSDRKRFHRWLRKRFKAGLLLYAWALEHGRETGLHHHYMVVLKRHGNEEHVELVDEIGMKWASITCGLGSIYNGNQRRNNHRFRALGLVRMDDPNVITGLQFIASYLTLPGVYVKLLVDMEVDAFGKGGKMSGDYSRRLRGVGRPPKRRLPFPIVISAAQGRARYVNFM